MQSHTDFHPCLPKCDNDEAEFEIANCKILLEQEYGFNINPLAFPNVDYTKREIEIAKKAGYKYCIALDKGFNLIHSKPDMFKGLDSNDTDNLGEFIIKTFGLQGGKTFYKDELLNTLNNFAQYNHF